MSHPVNAEKRETPQVDAHEFLIGSAFCDELVAEEFGDAGPAVVLADFARDIERKCSGLIEALELALPRLAHKASCASVRPASEWHEHGSWDFDNCACEIAAVRSALTKAKE
jgi:hypothetical protein